MQVHVCPLSSRAAPLRAGLRPRGCRYNQICRLGCDRRAVSSEGAEDDLKVDAAKCLSREARLLHLAKGEELHVEHLAAGRLDAANAHPVLRGRPSFRVLHIFCARAETREESVSRACMRDYLWTARTNAPPFMATFQSVSEISAATIVSPRSMAPDPVSSIILSSGAARADQ